MNGTILALALSAPALPVFCSSSAAQGCTVLKDVPCCTLEYGPGGPSDTFCFCDGDAFPCNPDILLDERAKVPFAANPGQPGNTAYPTTVVTKYCVWVPAFCDGCACGWDEVNPVYAQCDGFTPAASPDCVGS